MAAASAAVAHAARKKRLEREGVEAMEIQAVFDRYDADGSGDIDTRTSAGLDRSKNLWAIALSSLSLHLPCTLANTEAVGTW